VRHLTTPSTFIFLSDNTQNHMHVNDKRPADFIGLLKIEVTEKSSKKRINKDIEENGVCMSACLD